VLDEAHQLEDVATQYFGVIVSSHRLDDITGDCERWTVRALRGRPRDAVLNGIEYVRRHARRAFSAAERARTSGVEERFRLTPDIRASLVDTLFELEGALEGLESTMQLLTSGGGAESTRIEGDELDNLVALIRRIGEIRSDLRFVTRGDDPEFVYFAEVRGRGVFLRAAPIDVAAVVRRTVLERRRALRAVPPGDRPGQRDTASVGVRLCASVAAVPAAPDPVAEVAGLRRRSSTRDR
jgi:ATP-dependent DNA helicase DinG